MPKATLISYTQEYMEVLCTACSKPYGNNVTNKGVAAILKSGHLSILEHCYASFEVECSVRVLGQLTRHRHLSFTCKSARGSNFDTFYDPISKEVYRSEDCLCFLGYEDMLDDGAAEQDAAYWLPQGAMTDIVVTGNFRAWYEYLPKRLCRRAMPEHRELAELIHKELAKVAPEIFDRCFLNCEHCTERSCEFKH